jgi:hypothetical protein
MFFVPSDSDISLTIITAILLVFSLFLYLDRVQKAKFNPDEPPIIPSYPPFVGHVLGMIIYGGRYMKTLGYICGLFSLDIHFARSQG